MKRSVAAWSLTALVLMTLGIVLTPALGDDTYSIPAIKIPNTSILPNNKVQPVPAFIGQPAVADPISDATPVPQNPFMAEDPWNCIHNDSYQSDTYPGAGPLGKNPVVSSTWLGPPPLDSLQGIVVVMTLDRTNNLLIAAAIKSASGTSWVQLTLIDATNLATLARFDLPKEILVGRGFRPAGAYFYLNNNKRIVIGTKDRTVWLVSYSYDSGIGKWYFHHDNEDDPWDLTNDIPEGDSIEALQPDWSGRLWFTSRGGVVGTFNMGTGKVIGSLQLPGERIVNGHAAGEEGGVYIATTLAMYRFDADPVTGSPTITWRKTYDAGTHVKEGQTDIGTGTTPTLMGDKYVTISDNGQPQMHVLVYDRVDGRLMCAEPVFQPGQASNENSLIATDKSIIVENNFGYKDPEKDTTHGRTTKPGIARIDMDENGACNTVWTNESVSIPSVVSKMSLANGLIYTYTKPKGPATTDPWYFTAIDFHTGEIVWKVLAGIGILYNNHYAAAYLGPDGTLYVGVLGGIVAMRDGE